MSNHTWVTSTEERCDNYFVDMLSSHQACQKEEVFLDLQTTIVFRKSNINTKTNNVWYVYLHLPYLNIPYMDGTGNDFKSLVLFS